MLTIHTLRVRISRLLDTKREIGVLIVQRGTSEYSGQRQFLRFGGPESPK